MDGLRQIQVITQGDGWHLVGLDAEGRVWFGSPRRTTKGRMLAWVLMDESVEVEDPLPPVPAVTSGILEPGVADRHWPTKPRP
jgi:hypothetical protein